MPALPEPEFIDHFYQFTSETDWREGLDLYQSGGLIQVSTIESLVISKIQDNDYPRGIEVRIKLHAGKKFIQWIECSCRHNRMRGHFCRHIIATIFHLDREQHHIVQQLDPRMLIKPPKGRNKNTARANDTTQHSVLGHLQGAITKITQNAHGTIDVSVEIKKNVSSNYHLTIDQAATFSANNKTPYRLTTHTAQQAILVEQKTDEAIVISKIVTVSLNTSEQNALQTASVLHNNDRSENCITYIAHKQVENCIGTNYFFLPRFGYLQLQTDHAWESFKDRKYHGDQVAVLLKDNFAELESFKDVYIDTVLKDNIVIEDDKRTKIIVENEDNGVFRLSLAYEKDEIKIPLTKLLNKKKKQNYIKINKEEWFKLPAFLADSNWLTDESGEYIFASLLDMHRLRAALGDYDTFVGSRALLSQLRAKTSFDEMVDPPSLEQSNLCLRSYQHFGFKWLWWLYRNKLHGLLADEMGLGKTHQAMALLSAVQSEKKDFCFLVVAPTTVLSHWQDKITEFAPRLSPLMYHGRERFAFADRIAESNLTLVTSYGVLHRDIGILEKNQWDVVVLDEAHYVKNNKTHTYRAVCKLPNAMRLCLSGTPFENDLRELKSIFDFLLPGYLGSDRFFRKHILQSLVNENSIENEIVLNRLLHPFKLRRTKEAVLFDLPDKVIDYRSCALMQEQQQLYQQIVELKAKPISQKLQENNIDEVPVVHIFAVLNLLKQICNHPLMLLGGTDINRYRSGKFELLKELVFEGIQSQQKIVIYSQYVKMVEIISKYLQQEKIKHVTMTGASKKRGELISQFQEDTETKVFVATLLTGGIGIDLTSASIVIHYDRWWNASKENQATDRVHRIGQNKNVQVFKLITKNTFEEKIDKLIRKKQDLFEKYLEKDEELFKNMSRKDLIELLN